MKNKILYSVMMCLALITAACSTEVFYKDETSPDIKKSYLRLVINKEDMTRGIITSSSFQEGDSILVAITARKDREYMTIVTRADYKTGEWIIDPNNSFDFNEMYNGITWDFADVSVYYPYDIARQGYDENANTVKIDNLTSQTDILFGRYEGVTKENPTAKITCQHALTCLTFSLKNNSTHSVQVEKLEMEPGYSRFLGYAGNLTNKGLDDIKYDYSGQIKYSLVIPAGETRDLNFLLAPTEEAYRNMLNEGNTSDRWAILLTINGTLTYFEIDLNIWEAGTQYVYPVNLPTDIPERQPKKIYMYDNDEGKAVYWADINIGACSETDCGHLFGWGDPTGKITTENLDDYPSANPPENIAGTEYDIATANWGGKWRMPSDEDIRKISYFYDWDIRNNFSYKTEEIEGTNGLKITNIKSGEYIFLPSTPILRKGESANFLSPGFGNYWLSDIVSWNKDYAYTIFFGNTEFDGWQFRSSSSYRYMGLPVRPIWVDD